MSIEKEPALYCLVLCLENVLVLNETKNEQRMRADIEVLKIWRCWVKEVNNLQVWENSLADFKSLIGDEPAREKREPSHYELLWY